MAKVVEGFRVSGGIRILKSCCSVAVLRRYSSSERILEVNVGERQIKFSSGKYAKLAAGAVVAKLENTSVLVTAVSEEHMKNGASFTPLIVDYRERASAAGRIPYNFFRRELRPMEREIVTSRLIDRSIRPLFPEGYAYNTQIICNLLSVDGIHDQEVLSINGACAALIMSDIPWNGPIAAVRIIADSNGGFIVNPTKKQARSSNLNIILVSKDDRIIMVEGFGNEISEEQFCSAIKFGMVEAQKLLNELQTLKSNKLRDVELLKPSDELMEAVTEYCMDKLMNIFTNTSHKKVLIKDYCGTFLLYTACLKMCSKLSRDKELFSLKDEVVTHLKDKEINFPSFIIEHAFWNTAKKCMELLILNKGVRCDGRGMHDLRPIECEVDLFQLLHGSARFSRGETQVMSSVTFDSIEHAAKADEISLLIGAERSGNFMIHYDFPPYANNRTGHFMMPGRREIGHGALADKSLRPLLPKDFPFTIRIVSQVTDSNGSSSMATVCGSSLALFDAGVPMSKSAAGVACGLILDTVSDSNDTSRYQILSDITGIEDALGCMDFKMAGTKDGITSCQIDIKNCTGLTYKILEEAVFQSRESRLKVLDKMEDCQALPRSSLKENGPAYETIDIPSFKRSKVIGSGGHKIRLLIEETGARIRTIDTEKMSIFAPSRAIMNEVKERMEKMMNELSPEEENLEVDAVYDARIVDIRSYGVMIDLLPDNIRVLLHLSEISHTNAHPERLGLKIGDEIKVKYVGRDEVTDRIQVSRKVLLDPPSALSQDERQNIREENLEVDAVYDARIVDIRSYGVMIDLLPDNIRTLLHLSEISHTNAHPERLGLKIGDEIKVKYLGKDGVTDRIRVSRKVLLDPPSRSLQDGQQIYREDDIEVGTIFDAHVVEIRSYGVMIDLLPDRIRTLLHSSEISHNTYSDKHGLKIGDEIKVKYLGKNESTNKLMVSRKILLEKHEALKVGETYNSCITDIRQYGLMVELLPNQMKTFLSSSEIDHHYVNPLNMGYKVGDKIEVKYLGLHKGTGKRNISRKPLIAPPTVNTALKEGNIYIARILELKLSGFMVELIPGGEPTLLGISEIDNGWVNPLRHGYSKGDEIAVKYVGINETTGEIQISRRLLLAPPTTKLNVGTSDRLKNEKLQPRNQTRVVQKVLPEKTRKLLHPIEKLPEKTRKLLHPIEKLPEKKTRKLLHPIEKPPEKTRKLLHPIEKPCPEKSHSIEKPCPEEHTPNPSTASSSGAWNKLYTAMRNKFMKDSSPVVPADKKKPTNKEPNMKE